MLTLGLPAVLLALGTVLMAIVIFTPVRTAESVTVSCAPPVAFAAIGAFDPPPRPEPVAYDVPALATWPSLVDPRAGACDEGARCALVQALADVRSEWARTVLECAGDDDPSATVRAAAAAALSAFETADASPGRTAYGERPYR